MKTHIEYDDFGEFIETLDDVQSDHLYQGAQAAQAEEMIRRTVRAFLLFFVILTAMLPTTSFAAGISAVPEISVQTRYNPE